jgi:small subunit ribosomal protein S21
MAVRVQIKNNEPLEKTLRRLRKICNNEGITRELKRHAYFEKPSERRRRKDRERIKTIRLSQTPPEGGVRVG